MHAHSASGLLALFVDEPAYYREDAHEDDKRSQRWIHDDSFRLNRLCLLPFLSVLIFHCRSSLTDGAATQAFSRRYRE